MMTTPEKEELQTAFKELVKNGRRLGLKEAAMYIAGHSGIEVTLRLTLASELSNLSDSLSPSCQSPATFSEPIAPVEGLHFDGHKEHVLPAEEDQW